MSSDPPTARANVASAESARNEETASNARSDQAHAIVQVVLRGGMVVSVLLMAAGLAVRLASGRHDAPAARVHEALAFGVDPGLALTTLGILALALTPALRVLALVGIWWRERDRRFVAVAAAVVTALVAATLVK